MTDDWTPNIRLPSDAQRLLQAYLALIDGEQPGLVTAFYLHGSLALGAFNARYSDLDFIAVLSRRPGHAELDTLRQVHRHLRRQFPLPALDGCYIQPEDLGRLEAEVGPYPWFNDGRLHASGHHALNQVTWWQMEHGGVAVRGPSPQSLGLAPDWGHLITDMAENLNTYWARWANSPVQRAKLLTDYCIQWAVLGVLRQYCSFREGNIVSKPDAGRYALEHLPADHHRIIREALTIREGIGPSLYRSRFARAGEATRLLRHVIADCNLYLAKR